MSTAQNPQGKVGSLCSQKDLARNNNKGNIVDDDGDVEKDASVKSAANMDGTDVFSGPGCFSIRQYVLTVRAKDIGKNWPFSQRYLQICLENGKEPLLPPFEPSCSLRDRPQDDLENEAQLGHGSETLVNDASSKHLLHSVIEKKSEDPKHSEDQFVNVHRGKQGSKHKSHKRNKKTVSRELMQSKSLSRSGKECAVAENTVNVEELRDMRGDSKQEKDMPRNLRLNNDADQETDGELMISCESQGEDCDAEASTPQCLESEDAQIEVTETNSEPMSKEWDKRAEQTEAPLTAKSGRETCEIKGNKTVTSEMRSQDDNKKEHTIERNKAEGGRSEDIGNSGTLPDAAVPKVCPVCRTFSSTSNTALNAHIDHCLSVESNVKKIGTKFAKPKVKARKKRSMVDICAVAPTCTLEDLDRSTNGEQWALDTNPLPLDDLNWRERKKRRQSQTYLAKECETKKVHVDPKGKKLRILSSLKGHCQPNLSKVFQQRKRSVCDERNDESSQKKNKKVALSSSTQFLKGARQSLDASSFRNIKNKAPVTSQAKHTMNEVRSKGKSQNASPKTLCEERMSRSGSVNAQTCFNKGWPRANKVKKKLVSLNQAGRERSSSNQNDGVPLDVLQTIDRNQLEAGMQQSCAKSLFPQSHKAHDIYVIITGKTDNARPAIRLPKKHCSSAVENADVFTFQRKKHFSTLSFLNRTKQKTSEVQSSICETLSPPLETCQGDEKRMWLYNTDNEKQKCEAYVDEIPGNVFKAQDSDTIAVSTVLENETGLPVDATQPFVSCHWPRAEAKDQSLQNNLLENLSTSAWPIGLCKSETNHKPEHSNGEKQQARPSKCNTQSQKAEEVANVVKDLKIVKDGTEVDVGKRVRTVEHSMNSPKAIYNVESTYKQADILNKKDCTIGRAQWTSGFDTSAMDEHHSSSATLLSATKPASQLPTQPLKMSVPVNAEYAGLVNENQTQLDSTVCTLCQDSQLSFTDEVGCMSRYLGNNTSVNDPARLNSGSPGLLETPSRITAYERDVSIQGLINEVTHVLTAHQGNHLNSSALTAHANIDSNDFLQKKVCPQSHSAKQFTNIPDVLKERVQSIPLQKQALRSRLPTQNEISCLDLMSAAASVLLSPSNRELRSCARDTMTSLTSTASICASINNYLYNEPVVQQSKSHLGPPFSRGTIAINSSDSIRVTPVSSNTKFTNRPQIFPLVTENTQILDSDLGNIKEGSYATTHNFVNLAEAVFTHSMCSHSSASLIGLPLTSHGDLLQERSTLLKNTQFVDQQCSFGRSMKLTSVTAPQVVSASLLAGDSGNANMSEEVLQGSVLNENIPNSSNFQINQNAIQQSSHNNSAWLLEKQNGLKQTQNNALPGVLSGTDRNCVGKHVLGFSPNVYGVQNDTSGLISSNPNYTNSPSGFLNTSRLYRATPRNQIYVPDAAFSSGLVTTQWQSDVPAGFPSMDNVDYTGPNAAHLFGNPILRLMGKNLMVANKDCEKSRQLDPHPTSREEYPNANYLRLLGFTSEANFGLEGNVQVRRPPEACATFDQNLLRPLESVRQDSRYLWNYNDHGYQPPTATGNLSEVWVRNSAGSPSQSSIGTSLTNMGSSRVRQSCPSSTAKNLESHIPLTLMENGILQASAGKTCQAKWQPPAAVCSQSDHEVIVIDDDAEPVSNVGDFQPSFASGWAHQLQEGLSTPMLSKLNSKFWSAKTFPQFSSTPRQFSSDKESTMACGSDLLSAKELQAELRKLGISNGGNSDIILQNSIPSPTIVPNHGSQKVCYVQGTH